MEVKKKEECWKIIDYYQYDYKILDGVNVKIIANVVNKDPRERDKRKVSIRKQLPLNFYFLSKIKGASFFDENNLRQLIKFFSLR